MNKGVIKIFVADDNYDDCLLFKEALSELPFETELSIVEDGRRLMEKLRKDPANLPDVLFLDLNMPRKNGYECLNEIKADEQLKDIRVIVFSSSLEEHIVNLLYESGADLYIRKPDSFTKLKTIISDALSGASS